MAVVLGSPTEMNLRSGRAYREPDILVVLNEHRHRFSAQRLEGPADIVFELLTSESLARDRDEKRTEYESVGIREHWIIDATESRNGLRAYALSKSGPYEPLAPAERGRTHSRFLTGFWLDPAWFTADDLPGEATVIRTLVPRYFGSLKPASSLRR
jgi:Uma2 family endonuclease